MIVEEAIVNESLTLLRGTLKLCLAISCPELRF